MSEREKAMREAAMTVTIDHEPEAEQVDIATAGADAELARVVAFVRQFASTHDCRGCPNMEPNVSLNQVADAIEARAHWKDEQ